MLPPSAPADLDEPQYRAGYLADDIAQCRFALLVLIAPLLPFLYFDYRFFGLAPIFYLLAGVRLSMLTYTLWLWQHLPRMTQPQQLDRHMLAWSVIGALVLLFANATRPPEFVGHHVIDVWVVLMFFAAVPLPVRAQLLPGVLFVGGSLALIAFYKQPPTVVYTFDAVIVLLLSLGCGVMLSARIHRYRRAALKSRVELEHQARTDPLTGIANRRALMAAAALECERHERSGEPLAVILFDLDDFKRINDAYGHEAGDTVLAEAARRTAGVLRSYDLCARVGGEEFCVILPGTQIDDAVATAERIRQTLGVAPVRRGAERLTVTASFGVAAYQRGEGSIEPALARADAALYQAKREGRDRVAADRRTGPKIALVHSAPAS